jgi:hypothetical protein
MTDPDVGQFLFTGQQGVTQFIVEMTTDRTVLAVAADAAVMGSAIAGNNGAFHIECQQTSEIYGYLLAWHNAKVTRQLNGDVTTWFSMTVSIRDASTQRGHVLRGVAPSKIPNYPRGAQGTNVTWVLPAADVINS